MCVGGNFEYTTLNGICTWVHMWQGFCGIRLNLYTLNLAVLLLISINHLWNLFVCLVDDLTWLKVFVDFVCLKLFLRLGNLYIS